MAIPATQIRRGMVIVFEGEPCRVVEFRHHTPGNLRAMIQTKLRSIRTGSSFEHRFRSVDTIEKASLEQHEMEYLYWIHPSTCTPSRHLNSTRWSTCTRMDPIITS